MQDQQDNAIAVCSLAPPYVRKLLRGLKLNIFKHGQRPTTAYDYQPAKWRGHEKKLLYDDLILGGENICGDVALHLSYEDTPLPKGNIKDEMEKDIEICLLPTELPITIQPGTPHLCYPGKHRY